MPEITLNASGLARQFISGQKGAGVEYLYTPSDQLLLNTAGARQLRNLGVDHLERAVRDFLANLTGGGEREAGQGQERSVLCGVLQMSRWPKATC